MTVFAFGGFTLDTETRQLARGALPLHLEPKALELLELLLERRPAAVAKAEIQRRLWPDTFVSESSLTGLVAQVRRATGDGPREGRFVRTVHGFGYAFAGTAVVQPPRDPAVAARLVWEEVVLPLREGENVLGRGEEATVRIDVPEISRRHAVIVVAGDAVTLADLGSKNGTTVGGTPVTSPVALRDGDRLHLGPHLLVFRRSGPSAATWSDPRSPRGG